MRRTLPTTRPCPPTPPSPAADGRTCGNGELRNSIDGTADGELLAWLEPALEREGKRLRHALGYPWRILRVSLEITRAKAVEAVRTGLAARLVPPARRRWLRTVAGRDAATVWRRAVAGPLPADGAGIPSRTGPDPGDLALVVEGVATLPPDLRAIIDGLYYDESSVRGVAETVGMTAYQVGRLHEAALELLRRFVDARS